MPGSHLPASMLHLTHMVYHMHLQLTSCCCQQANCWGPHAANRVGTLLCHGTTTPQPLPTQRAAVQHHYHLHTQDGQGPAGRSCLLAEAARCCSMPRSAEAPCVLRPWHHHACSSSSSSPLSLPNTPPAAEVLHATTPTQPSPTSYHSPPGPNNHQAGGLPPRSSAATRRDSPAAAQASCAPPRQGHPTHPGDLSPGDASTALHGVEVGHCCHGQGQGSQHGAASNQAVQEVPVEGEGEGEGGTGSRGQVAGECSCW